MLEIMTQIIDDFPDYQFVIAGAPSQDREIYEKFLHTKRLHLVMNRTYDLLQISTAALVTSGTATLETALFKVPEVVCYKGSMLSYQIAKRIVNLRFISLVNLIMDREVVRELIQKDFNRKNLGRALSRILDPMHREKIFSDYFELEQKLGGPGASEKTARLIYSDISDEAVD